MTRSDRPTAARPTAKSVIVGAVLVAVVAVAATAVALGASTLVLFAGAALPWFVVVARRSGSALAVGAVAIVSLSALVFVTMATAALSAPMLFVVTIAWTVAGLLGAILSAWPNGAVSRPSTRALAVGIASLFGGGVWIGALIVAAKDGTAGVISWVMTGDSPNNVLFAREFVYRGGIAVGAGENPVPLPAAAMGISMASGRGSVAPADLLDHDLLAFALLWAAVVVALAFFLGVVAGSIASSGGAGSITAAIVAGIASLLPLSWFFGTYPIEFGFFNTHLAAVVVLASFLVYLYSSRSPWLAFSLLMLACTLLLAVWSPLVLLGGGLALALLIGQWRSLLDVRGIRLAMMAAALLQLLIYGLAISLPSLINLQTFFAANGAVRSFSAWMVMGATVVVLFVVYLAMRFLPATVSRGVALLVLFSGVGLVALLFLARSAGGWTYYPLKFAWLVAVIMFAVTIGLLPALIVRLAGPWERTASVAAVVAVTMGVSAFLVVGPDPENLGIARVTAVDWVARDLPGAAQLDTAVAQEILDRSDPASPAFLFRSGDPAEGMINFWLLEMRADSMSERNDLRVYSYGIYEDTTEDLCAIVAAIGGDVEVVTQDASLVTAVDECADFNGRIVVQAPPLR